MATVKEENDQFRIAIGPTTSTAGKFTQLVKGTGQGRLLHINDGANAPWKK